MITIYCNKCGEKIHEANWLWKHEPCGGTLTVILKDLQSKRFNDLINKRFKDMRRYLKLLPINAKYMPRISVGFTPLVKRKIFGLDVYFKMEYFAPSGSFKDRGAYVTLAKILELKIKNIIEDSSGNAGIAFTLMAKLSNVKANIFIPKSAPEGKKLLLKTLGAKVFEVKGSREKVNEEAIKAEKKGLGVYVGHWWNPFFIEGLKTIAYELWEKIGDKITHVIVPVGSGGLLLGIYKGYKELKEMGEIHKIPKIVGVQASGFETLCGKVTNTSNVNEHQCSKLADGIMIRNPPRIDEMVDAIKGSNGTCIVVNDSEIKKALRKLLHMGFIVEPTSATVLAALKKGVVLKYFTEEDKIAVILTGSGLKVLRKIISIMT